MRQLVVVAGLLIISLLGFQHHTGVVDYWRSQVFLGVTAALIFMGAQVWRRIGALPAGAFTWAAMSAAFVSCFPNSPYASSGLDAITASSAYSAQAGFCLLAIAISAIMMSKKDEFALMAGLRAAVAIDSVMLLVRWFWIKEPTGLLGNASMDGCFIATMLPLVALLPGRFGAVCASWSVIGLCLACLAIFASGSSLAVGVLGVVTVAVLARVVRLRFVVGAVAVLAGLGFLTMGPAFLSDSGRFGEWSIQFQWWAENANAWLGAGSGTFMLIGPNVQAMAEPPRPESFLFLHSDWLQVVFEQGIVGLVLVVALFAQMLWRSRGSPRVFAAVLGYGAWAWANMPLRYALGALVGVLLIRLVYVGEDGIQNVGRRLGS